MCTDLQGRGGPGDTVQGSINGYRIEVCVEEMFVYFRIIANTYVHIYIYIFIYIYMEI